MPVAMHGQQRAIPPAPPRRRLSIEAQAGIVFGGLTGENNESYFANYTCEDLADEALLGAEEDNSGFGASLLDVRQPEIVEDHRTDYVLPEGIGDALILQCQGMGVWSDASREPVDLKLTADSEGMTWIACGPPGTI